MHKRAALAAFVSIALSGVARGQDESGSSAPPISLFGVAARFGIPYASPEGTELLLDAYLPEGEGPFPAVIVIHGGGWRSGDRKQLAIHAWWFARSGLAAFAIEYRLAPAHPWPAQIHDCKAAVRFVSTHAAEFRVDPKRIGAHGYSAGGHLALLLGTAGPELGLEGVDSGLVSDTRVAAVSAGGAPVDFRGYPGDHRGFAWWLGGTPGEMPEVYTLASPLAHVTSDDPPAFLFHGGSDTTVSSRGPRAIVDAFKEAGVEATYHEIRGMGHIGAAIHPDSFRLSARFLSEKLGN